MQFYKLHFFVNSISMVIKSFEIINEAGLHMRAAAELVNSVKGCNCVITAFDGRRLNGNSLIDIMSGGIKCGDIITLSISGKGESAVMEKAERLFKTGFGEKCC